MELWLFRHLWGVTGDWAELFPRFVAKGYRGVETGVPAKEQRERFRTLLDEHKLGYIAQIFTQGATVEEHIASFRTQLEDARRLDPLLINSHSGRDAWSEAEAERFFAAALEVEHRHGTPVAHETHRQRVLFHPWATGRLLERLPDLRLCADFSHWTCVCERMLDDQHELLRQVAARCIHTHARVGYEEGPQVPDPRAPEYQRHLQAHEQWWDWIWDAQQAAGRESSFLTPEFGPPGYLHTLPYTNVPVADLEAICDWQARRQAERFGLRGQ